MDGEQKRWKISFHMKAQTVVFRSLGEQRRFWKNAAIEGLDVCVYSKNRMFGMPFCAKPAKRQLPRRPMVPLDATTLAPLAPATADEFDCVFRRFSLYTVDDTLEPRDVPDAPDAPDVPGVSKRVKARARAAPRPSGDDAPRIEEAREAVRSACPERPYLADQHCHVYSSRVQFECARGRECPFGNVHKSNGFYYCSDGRGIRCFSTKCAGKFVRAVPEIQGVERPCADWLRDQAGEPMHAGEETVLFANGETFDKRTKWLSIPRGTKTEYRHFGMHQLLEDAPVPAVETPEGWTDDRYSAPFMREFGRGPESRVAVVAAMGAGKSTQVYGIIKRFIAMKPDARVVYITPRRKLCTQVLSRLDSFQDYRDIKVSSIEMKEYQLLMICSNSLSRVRLRDSCGLETSLSGVDLVVFDEFELSLDWDGLEKSSHFKALERLLTEPQRVIVMDADLTNQTLEILRRFGWRAHLVVNDFKRHAGRTFRMLPPGVCLSELVEPARAAVRTGAPYKAFAAVSSKRELKGIKRTLEDIGMPTIAFHGDADSDVLGDINEQLGRPRQLVVLTTSAMAVGNSFDRIADDDGRTRFDALFVFACGGCEEWRLTVQTICRIRDSGINEIAMTTRRIDFFGEAGLTEETRAVRCGYEHARLDVDFDATASPFVLIKVRREAKQRIDVAADIRAGSLKHGFRFEWGISAALGSFAQKDKGCGVKERRAAILDPSGGCKDRQDLMRELCVDTLDEYVVRKLVTSPSKSMFDMLAPFRACKEYAKGDALDVRKELRRILKSSATTNRISLRQSALVKMDLLAQFAGAKKREKLGRLPELVLTRAALVLRYENMSREWHGRLLNTTTEESLGCLDCPMKIKRLLNRTLMAPLGLELRGVTRTKHAHWQHVALGLRTERLSLEDAGGVLKLRSNYDPSVHGAIAGSRHGSLSTMVDASGNILVVADVRSKRPRESDEDERRRMRRRP